MNVCKSCRYYVPDPYQPAIQGECHRFPPQYGGHGDTKFPTVNHSDWCGECKPPRKNKENKEFYGA
jgi:hypothetical protein